MSDHGPRSTNYMDDDTCEISCRCGWESTGHEDEDEAEAALDKHVALAEERE